MSEPEEPVTSSEHPTTETEANGEKELKSPAEDSEKEEVLYYTYKGFFISPIPSFIPVFGSIKLQGVLLWSSAVACI